MDEKGTPLGTLAAYTVNFDLSRVPGHVVRAAEFCVLDTLGSALGASHDPELSELCRTVRKLGSGNGYQASVWGYDGTLNLNEALLLNGMMAHALELDDVHTASKSHIGAVVVPAAWACAEALERDGKAFLEAVLMGYEVMGRIGKAMDVVSNRKRGWHTTGIIGTFGAAAAAGKLLGLDRERMISALGMAGTQSSGLWAFLGEGSSCKKLHPARAAVNGVTAAFLAAGGMTGPEHILDAEDGGLYRAVSDRFYPERLTDGIGGDYEILHMDKKPYPCCRTTHHAIDAALALREQAGAEEMEEIRVETYGVGVLQCGSRQYPGNPGQAKFSIPYTAAAALVKGRVTQEEFTEEALADPRIRKLASCIRVEEAEEFTDRYPGQWGSRMTITLKDGTTIQKQVDDMSGSEKNPLSEKQETDKFIGLAGAVYQDERRVRLMKTILSLETCSRLPGIFGEGRL